MSTTRRQGSIAAAVALLATAATAVAQVPEPFVLEADAASTAAFEDQFYGAVTAGPGEYFAVWVDLRSSGPYGISYDLYGQRILPDGSVGNGGSIELLRDPARLTEGVPAVAWNGTLYLVAWFESGTLFGMRVAPDGEVLDPGGFPIGVHAGPLEWPAVASDGQDFLVVHGSGDSILAHRVAGDGSFVGAPIVVSGGASGLGYPKVAFGAGVYTVVWAQTPAQAIRAARITPAGQVLDPGGVNVSGGGIDLDAHVDFDGTDFYVVWQRQDGSWWDLWGAHVSPQAQVVSGPTLLLDGNTWGSISSGQVAFNGTDHLVTITTAEPVFLNTDLYALKVSAAGAPLGPPIPVSTLEARSQAAFGVASVGDQFFILWEGNYVRGVFYVYDTEGARVDAGGTVLDWPDPIKVARSAAYQILSATSFDGENFLCVFEDWRADAPTYAPMLYGMRVSPQGSPLAAVAFPVKASGPGVPGHPDSVFGGGVHAIVSQNAVAGSVTEVRLTRVLPDGTVLDPEGVVVFANEPTAQTLRPKVAWNGERFGVVWFDDYLFPGQERLQFALVEADGTVAYGPANVPEPDGAAFDGFEIASNGDEFLIVWVDWGFDDIYRVKATRVSASGAILGTSTVQTAGEWTAELPQACFNGASYLVAWRQHGPGGPRLDARLLNQSGAPASALVTVAGPGGSPAWPSGIFEQAGEFVIVAPGEAGVYSARVDSGGALVEGPDLLMPAMETFGDLSAAMTPAGGLLLVHSLWAGNPWNAPRAQGHLFNLGAAIPGDVDGDGAVGILDLLALLAAWGPCPGSCPPSCAADLDGDCAVGIADLLALLAGWTG